MSPSQHVLHCQVDSFPLHHLGIGITQMNLCSWLFQLTLNVSRFIDSICGSISRFFLQLSNILSHRYILFIHSSADEHLCGFYFFLHVHKEIMTFPCKSLSVCIHFSWILPGWNCQVHLVILCSLEWFIKCLYHFTFPSAMCEGF